MKTANMSNTAELISAEQYSKLADPKFLGQTPVDKDGCYRMFWLSQGVLYKTNNKIM